MPSLGCIGAWGAQWYAGIGCLALAGVAWCGLFRVGLAAQNSPVEPLDEVGYAGWDGVGLPSPVQHWDEVGYAGWGILGCPGIPDWEWFGCSRLPRRA